MGGFVTRPYKEHPAAEAVRPPLPARSDASV
jgi:hypothetical protein